MKIKKNRTKDQSTIQDMAAAPGDGKGTVEKLPRESSGKRNRGGRGVLRVEQRAKSFPSISTASVIRTRRGRHLEREKLQSPRAIARGHG